MNRRKFLNTSSLFFLGSPFLSAEPFLRDPETIKLVILHTNDVHSRIEPFPMDGGRNAGKGGAARRAQLIKEIRAQEEHVLLLDSGDIFQGTPYFNFFGGELEFKLMSEMGYDASTLGNHDFDAGLDGLAKQMPHANFTFVSSNYDFSDTQLAGQIKPYQIFSKGPLRIGVFGVGIELKGLVPANLYGATRYLNPITEANRIAKLLKKEEDCDLVICLSHLGYRYREEKVSDLDLADFSYDIDVILGGHTHTFMGSPDIRNNRRGRPVVINQVGWAGLMLGRLDVHVERNRRKQCVTCENRWVI